MTGAGGIRTDLPLTKPPETGVFLWAIVYTHGVKMYYRELTNEALLKEFNLLQGVLGHIPTTEKRLGAEVERRLNEVYWELCARY